MVLFLFPGDTSSTKYSRQLSIMLHSGKSLTYQLPALLEGRSQSRKITLVVSPLLSLIRDQEEQMNEFASGSAVAFTSGIGQSEQTRRWQLVRDRNSGVCIIFVTPERVFKSNKLRSELEKLNDQNRLGRFVIDECKICSLRNMILN